MLAHCLLFEERKTNGYNRSCLTFVHKKRGREVVEIQYYKFLYFHKDSFMFLAKTREWVCVPVKTPGEQKSDK